MASAAGGRMYVVETDRKKEKGIDRIMISENLKKYATEKFEGRRELLAPVMPVIEEKLKQCSEEEVVLMKFLYGTMPVRDAGEYGFNLFLSYVKHALMLREKVAWCKELPVIALMGGVMAGYMSGDMDLATMMAPIMYFVGIAAVLVSAIMLKKTKPFSGKPAPFVMELPAYHIPSAKTVLLHVWERLKGFIIKAGTILFLACVVMWFLSSFGFVDGSFGLVEESADSILAMLGGAIAILFRPLGFGEWQPVAASITGFTAKEAIVSTMGVLANVSEDLSEETDVVAAAIQTWFPTTIAAFTFLLFNLLDSPCLAAIATMAQQLQSRKWFWFAILYQNLFAYAVSLIVYQLGGLVLGAVAFNVWTIVAAVLLVFMLFMLFRPDPYKDQKSYTRSSVEAAS